MGTVISANPQSSAYRLAKTRWQTNRTNPRDEFHTSLEDVAAELVHYRQHFEGASVYLNCDDPRRSAFHQFLSANFDNWRLRRLAATHWNGMPTDGLQLALGEKPPAPSTAWKLEIHREQGSRQKNQVLTPLQGNGDFRSPECAALLEEADMVVTNPPFSLFREYFDQIVSHGKQFLVLAPLTSLQYESVWGLIKDGQVWMGVNSESKRFRIPDGYGRAEDAVPIGRENRSEYVKLSNTIWLTNMDHGQHPPKLSLVESYDPVAHPVYDQSHSDGSPIINVDQVSGIPCDYYGPMGVPITFLLKHNPAQFELLDCLDPDINGIPQFARIVIRRIDAPPDPEWALAKHGKAKPETLFAL